MVQVRPLCALRGSPIGGMVELLAIPLPIQLTHNVFGKATVGLSSWARGIQVPGFDLIQPWLLQAVKE